MKPDKWDAIEGHGPAGWRDRMGGTGPDTKRWGTDSPAPNIARRALPRRAPGPDAERPAPDTESRRAPISDTEPCRANALLTESGGARYKERRAPEDKERRSPIRRSLDFDREIAEPQRPG